MVTHGLFGTSCNSSLHNVLAQNWVPPTAGLNRQIAAR
jgi:hypothetical protein